MPAPTEQIVRIGLFLLGLATCTGAAWRGADGSAVLLGLLWLLFASRACRAAAVPPPLPLPPPLPPPLLGLLALALAAWNAAGWTAAGGREITQLFLLLGCGLGVGSRMSTPGWRDFAGGVSAALLLNLAAAFLQLASPELGGRLPALLYGPPGAPGFGPDLAEEVVTGLFPSHSRYGAFCCLAAPLLLEECRSRVRGRPGWLLQMLLLAAVGQTLCDGWFLLVFAAAALVYFSWPENSLSRSRLAALLVCLLTLLAFAKPWAPAAARAQTLATLQPFNNLAGHERQPKRLFIETAAVLEDLPGRPLGHGPGTYRDAVRLARVRAELPRPLENRVRRDSNSQYAVFALEYGWPAAACLLLLLGSALLQALHTGAGKAKRSEAPGARSLPAALLALLLAGCGTVFLSRGLGALAGVLVGAALAPALENRGRGWRAAARALLPAAILAPAAALLLPGLLMPGRTDLRTPQTLAPVADSANRPADSANPDAEVRIAAGDGIFFFIEAENYLTVKGPATTAEGPDLGGNRCVSIPEAGAKGAAEITYQLRPPRPGSYKLWLRVFWEGGCGNSVNCRLDDGRQFTVEDSIFDRWHWVDIAAEHRFELGAEHKFTLSGTEGGVHIDQIAFFADPRVRPDGILQAAAAAAPASAAGVPGFDSEALPEDREFDKY